MQSQQDAVVIRNGRPNNGCRRRHGMERLESRNMLASGALLAGGVGERSDANEPRPDILAPPLEPGGAEDGAVAMQSRRLRSWEELRAALQLYLQLLQQREAAESAPAAPAKAPRAGAQPRPLASVPDYGAPSQWNLNAVNAPEAWAAGHYGQGVTVAVIDTGAQWRHSQLRDSIWKNRGEVAGNGVDDDGNGYVDDLIGWDFVGDDNNPDDLNGHGTHVSGVIAAARDGDALTGVAYGSQLMVLRALDDRGVGSTQDIAAAVRYAVDNGADIVNLSLGGARSPALEAAVQYAAQRGVLIVAAAGNDGGESPNSPASLSGALSSVISVGAVDQAGQPAAFTNRGGGAVQIVAPGVRIGSTVPGGGAFYSGTSMAAPHVSGVAALALSAAPNLTSAALRSLLVAGVAGPKQAAGLGLVDAAQVVAFAAAGYSPTAATSGEPAASASERSSSALRLLSIEQPTESSAPAAAKAASPAFQAPASVASREAPEAQRAWIDQVDSVHRSRQQWRLAFPEDLQKAAGRGGEDDGDAVTLRRAA